MFCIWIEITISKCVFDDIEEVISKKHLHHDLMSNLIISFGLHFWVSLLSNENTEKTTICSQYDIQCVITWNDSDKRVNQSKWK